MSKFLHHRVVRYLAVLILSGCLSAESIARADGADSLWEYSLHTARQCQGALNDGLESAAGCFLSDGINRLFDRGIGLADRRGKETFGEHFSLTGRMGWSPDVGSTGGLDMVTPFSFPAITSPCCRARPAMGSGFPPSRHRSSTTAQRSGVLFQGTAEASRRRLVAFP